MGVAGSVWLVGEIAVAKNGCAGAIGPPLYRRRRGGMHDGLPDGCVVQLLPVSIRTDQQVGRLERQTRN